MRTFTWLPAVLLPVFLGGCATLDRSVVRFASLPECPPTMAASPDSLGPSTPTRTLECTLESLRNARDPALIKSPLGSRVALYLAERETDSERREKLAAEGVRFAERAISLGADGDGAVHYYLAANLGLAVRDDFGLAVENLPRLESEMKRAVALSPGIDDGGPLRLLGALYLKAPPWPTGIGDGDKALELLRRAAIEYPGHPLNRLFLAQALWEVEGDDGLAEARAELATGLKLLQEGNWGYSRKPWEREFTKALEDIDDDESDETAHPMKAPDSAKGRTAAATRKD